MKFSDSLPKDSNSLGLQWEHRKLYYFIQMCLRFLSSNTFKNYELIAVFRLNYPSYNNV